MNSNSLLASCLRHHDTHVMPVTIMSWCYNWPYHKKTQLNHPSNGITNNLTLKFKYNISRHDLSMNLLPCKQHNMHQCEPWLNLQYSDHSHFYYDSIFHIKIWHPARASHLSYNDLLSGWLHEIRNAAQIDGVGQDWSSVDALYHSLARHLQNEPFVVKIWNLWGRTRHQTIL